MAEASWNLTFIDEDLKNPEDTKLNPYLDYINNKISNEVEQIAPLLKLKTEIYKVPDLFWQIEDSGDEEKTLNLFNQYLEPFIENVSESVDTDAIWSNRKK